MTTKICSIDPAFKRCGFVVMTDDFRIHHHENVDFLANHQKTDQTSYTIALWRAIKNKIEELNSTYRPDLWLIESQIGKFACVQVGSMLVTAISELGGRVVAQSPRCKLKDNLGLQDYVDSDSNKYNQNKNKSKAIASHFIAKSNQAVNLDRDVSDAILQCIYYIQNDLKKPLRYESFAQPVVPAATGVIQPVKPKKSKAKPVARKIIDEVVVVEIPSQQVEKPAVEKKTRRRKPSQPTPSPVIEENSMIDPLA